VIVEIRTYRLKPGTAQEFLRVVREEALPLLEKFGLRVLAAGISLAEGDDAYLIRAFPSLEEREEQENAFYGSEAWRDGPRAAVMACIDNYHTVVLEVAQFGLSV
jgi:NIPSNAP